MVSAAAPDSNIGTSPVGVSNSCQVLQNGALINTTCAEERNFGCEEIKLPPSSTEKMQALEAISAYTNKNLLLQRT
jgi:hypothetical protein